MKKPLFFLLLIVGFNNAYSQSPSLQQKLYYTCKVWGFVKYYHSNVSTCNVNWDSVLLKVLPAVKNAATNDAFNDALDTMLAAAGAMQLSTTYFPDTLPTELKRNRDWSWIDNSSFRPDVQVQLDTIRNNFRPHTGCYVAYNDYTTSNESLLIFPDDDTELNVNTYLTFPDQDSLLLQFFKYWNVVRYFYPYNYILDQPWDSTLYQYVVPVASLSDYQSYNLTYQKIAKNLDDAHVYGTTYSYYNPIMPGILSPPIRLAYIDSQYVVTKSEITNIYPGDEIVSVDGMTTAQWEDSLAPYISAGNPAVLKRTIYTNLLGRNTFNATEQLVFKDSSGSDHNLTVYCNHNIYSDTFFTNYFYPADSLDNIKWTILPCDIGYVNMGNLLTTDIPDMYDNLQGNGTIIFDLRNYPNGTFPDLAGYLYPNPTNFSKFTMPDISYPGTYFWSYDSYGYIGNPTAYTGKVIVLVNEITQSQAEFTTMMLRAIPGAIIVGSQTAGADGDISEWNLSLDYSAGMTTLGVFYPNGDSTQRIGIVPDSVVYPTRAGIRHHDDEVLDKALEIAGCNLSVRNVLPVNPTIKVFPNPADDIVNIEAYNIKTGSVTISICDVTGRTVMQKEADNIGSDYNASFNIKSFAPGVYFVNFQVGSEHYVTKIVKE